MRCMGKGSRDEACTRVEHELDDGGSKSWFHKCSCRALVTEHCDVDILEKVLIVQAVLMLKVRHNTFVNPTV